MNWLDIVLGLILVLSVIGGVRRGIARAGIGMAAVIVGLLCALWFYRLAGQLMQVVISSKPLANFVGFLAIFAGVLLLGSLLGMLADKFLRVVHLSWLNRLLGGAFGAVKGILICAVMVLLLMAFWPKPAPQAVAHSRIAPWVVGAASVMASAAPHEVHEGFHQTYKKIKQIWADAFQRKPRPAPTEEL